MGNNKLFRRDFTLVVIGQIISLFGSAIFRFALDLYVLDITGRADIFALVVALSAIPGIVLSPIGGAIADRFNRRNLMVIFDFTSSAIILLLLVLLGAGHAPVIAIGAVLAALSLISAMYQPAVQASVPVLVGEESLATANGIVSGVGALSGLLGPVIGGALYALLGLQTLIAVSGVAFFLSAVMEIFIHIPFERQARSAAIVPTIVSDMKTGLRYIARDNPQILRVILLAAALNLFLSPFFIVGIPYILRVTLRSSEMLYGIGMGIGQFATILGALSVGAFSKRMRISTLHRVLFLAALLLLPVAFSMSPAMLGLGYWPSFAMLMTFGAAIMLLVTAISIFVITQVQRDTPNALLGKVMAIIMAVSQCAAPIGTALYGFLFEGFSAAVYVPVLLACLFTAAIAFAARHVLGDRESVQKKEENYERV